MHILIIPKHYPTKMNPTKGSYFKEQAEALARTGTHVGVLASKYTVREVIRKRKITFGKQHYTQSSVRTYIFDIPYLPFFQFINNLINRVFGKPMILSYIRKYGKPDLVHLHSFHDGILALWILKQFGIPYVVTEHSSGFQRGLYFKWDLAFADRVYRYSSVNMAVSWKLSQVLSDKFNLSFLFVPNPVNTDFFTLKKDRSQLGKFTFVNISSFEAVKNQLTLIKAFHKGFRNQDNVQLAIAGDGKELIAARSLVSKLGLAKRIYLPGKISRIGARNLLQKSDAYVLASHYESFGIPAIEAMSCGLPVVAVRSDGPESIVTSEKYGHLCGSNVTALCSAMKNILTMTTNGYYDRKAIRQYVVDKFSETAVIDEWLQVYKRILNQCS